MLKRNIFALTRRDAESLLPEEARLQGWKLTEAADIGAARRLAAKNSFFVGIADFSSFQPEAVFPWQDELSSIHPRMLWLALVPPELLDDLQFRKDLAGRFFDYHTVPHDPQRLLIILGHAYGMAMLNPGKAEEQSKFNHSGLIGESPAMKRIYGDVKKAAGVDYPVLISGESGTGKELVAHAIHRSSGRREGPFVAVNCAALPGNLIHAELFGDESALTAHGEAKLGRVEAAHRGSLFLDEIGDLSTEMQAVLLRFLQEPVVRRLGSSREIPVDVRIVASTHVDLEAAVAAGKFREDLYYRLNVLRLTPPPLRERGNDIILLANYFLETFRGSDSQLAGFTSQALESVANHAWPGNVRELLNRVRRAVVMSENRLVTPQDLGFAEANFSNHRIMSLEQARTAAERHAIQVALWHAGHNVSVAAKSLEISRMTMYRLMEKVGLSGEKPAAGNGTVPFAETDVDPPRGAAPPTPSIYAD
ncbi:MAG: sigma-54-dependent Fis family transcriptional regulator [Methylococcaceae bacterium]|nr:sigma-54-dependent Fis family transcriptional regulator [Methylococcaceae bacterium]